MSRRKFDQSKVLDSILNKSSDESYVTSADELDENGGGQRALEDMMNDVTSDASDSED